MEMAQAALQERSRLAREIHDDLIPSLRVARLRQGHLLSMDLPPDARSLAETVVRALEDGLAGSGEATLVLAGGPDCSGSFDRILGPEP